MTTRLLLIRHGETKASAGDVFSGQDNVHLSDVGKEQARQLSARLAPEEISAIYSSPLDRALETADILSQPHALRPIVAEGLREINHGHWEGLTLDEVKSRFPDEYASWEADPFSFAPAGGDTGISVLARAMPALREIVVQHSGRSVMVISHKGTLRLAISSLLGFDPRLYRDRLDLSPASLSILDFKDPVQAQLVLYNDISHYSGRPQQSR